MAYYSIDYKLNISIKEVNREFIKRFSWRNRASPTFDPRERTHYGQKSPGYGSAC